MFTGLPAAETASGVTLKQQEGKAQTVLRKDIEELSAGQVSLLPDSLARVLSPQDVADVLVWLRNPPPGDEAPQTPTPAHSRWERGRRPLISVAKTCSCRAQANRAHEVGASGSGAETAGVYTAEIVEESPTMATGGMAWWQDRPIIADRGWKRRGVLGRLPVGPSACQATPGPAN